MAGTRYKDLTGMRVGLLKIIKPIENSGGTNKHKQWLCLCNCGNYCNVSSEHLLSKRRQTKSCGCLKHDNCSTNGVDMVGKKFGLLTVLNRVEERAKKGHHIKWVCKCDCGNTTIVDGSDLRKHNIISCGCKALSSGEVSVKKELDKYGISYKVQYKILEILTQNNGHPRMDFAIYLGDNLIAFIEYQGLQHYKDCGIFGKQVREETDALKIIYCEMKDVPLYEIKYNEDIPNAVVNILLDLKLIPCQASNEEGVTTIP